MNKFENMSDMSSKIEQIPSHSLSLSPCLSLSHDFPLQFFEHDIKFIVEFGLKVRGVSTNSPGYYSDIVIKVKFPIYLMHIIFQ